MGAEVGEELIDFLGAVAAATAQIRDLAFFAPLLPALEVSIIEAHPVVVTLLDAPAPQVRLRAAAAAVEQVRLPQLAAERRPLAARLRRWSAHQTPQRLQCVTLLGELGEQVHYFLTDADPAVRIRAALTPASRGDNRATDIIVATPGKAPPAGVHLSELVEAVAVAVGVESFEHIAEAAPPSPAGPTGPASTTPGVPCRGSTPQKTPMVPSAEGGCLTALWRRHPAP
ncbi:hypothetical protein AB0J63_30800 [Streptosporangium canum]|uniref:hypothetical protein n=1 Tax=Streptosporangium canum TaxID=324952 RepID=UPI00341C9ACF